MSYGSVDRSAVSLGINADADRIKVHLLSPLRSLVAIATALGLLGASMAWPGDAFALNCAGFCLDGTDGAYLVWQGKDHNDIAGSPSINGVYSENYVRWLDGCKYSGTSWSLGANLSGSTNPRVVQLGYGRTNGESLKFWWTTSDNSGGASSVLSWAGQPIQNHKYWFVIDETVAGKWRYCIKDITAGSAEVCNSAQTRSWSTGYLAWWAYETHDTTSVMGTSGSDPTASMTKLRYHHGSFANAWVIRTGMPTCLRFGGPPSKYACHVYSSTHTNDAFYVNTTGP